MSRVKVLQVIEDYQGIAGAEKVVYDLLHNIDAGKYQQHAAIIGEPRDDSLFANRGFSIEYVPRPSGFSPKLVKQLRQIFRERQIDIAHGHLMRMNSHVAMATWLSGIPGVGTIHGIMKEEETPVGRIYTRMAAAFNKRTVVVSETVRKQFVSIYKANEKKTLTINNAFDEPRVAIPPEIQKVDSFRANFQCNNKSPIIAAIGNIREVKGYKYLIDALSELKSSYPNICLLIAGADSNDYANELKAQVESLGLTENVRFLGLYREVAIVLAVADVYVCSSLHEGFSLTTVEAMAAGLPVIATRCGGPQDIIIDGETGFLTPVANSFALAETMKQLLNDGERARKMGEAGKKRAFECFSMDAFVQRHQLLYSELAKKPE